MTSVTIAYLTIAVFVIMALLMLIDFLIKRFMPIRCIFLFLGFVLAVFIYTLNR